MSYILDALQKAERERQRGVVPTLPIDLQSTQVEKKPAYLLYAVVALALLGAGVLIGWLQTLHASTLLQSPAGVAPAIKIASDDPRPAPAQRPLTRDTLPSVPVVPASLPKAKISDLSVSPLTTPSPTPHVEAAPAVPEVPTVAASKPSADASPAENRPSIADAGAITDLPSEIQKEIPAMNVLFHAYSSVPTQRLVEVNNKPLHEGDYLAPGLKLEQISADGMIFSYKGFRFKSGVR